MTPFQYKGFRSDKGDGVPGGRGRPQVELGRGLARGARREKNREKTITNIQGWIYKG